MVQKKIINYKNKNLYDKVLGFLIKQGKKTIAKNIFEKALNLLSKKLKKNKNLIFLRIFLKLNSFVEVKKVKIRNRIHFVPFAISLKRRSYLVIKWLLKSVNDDKVKKPVFLKLSNEIFEILTKSKSKTLKIKRNNNNQAFLNRSNSHFRW